MGSRSLSIPTDRQITVVRRSGSSEVLRWEEAEGSCFLKIYRYQGLKGPMRGAFRNTFAAPSRAAREDRALRHLAECGIQPELALGYAERRWLGWLREARLLTRGFGDEDLAQRIERRRAESEARPGLRADELPGLGAFLGAIFDSGLVDPDLRVRNLLCAGTGEATRWAKIDASSSRIRRRPLGPAERARDLAPLLEELRAAGCDETALAELSSAARASPARR